MKVALQVKVTAGSVGVIDDTLEVQTSSDGSKTTFSIPVTATVVSQGESNKRLAKGVEMVV